MRRLLYAMKEIRKDQIKDSATTERLAEVDAKFNFLDAHLSGVFAAGSAPEQFIEVMTSGDFTYAIQEFVQRKALPGYQRKMFNFEAFVKPDTVPNYLPST